MSRPGRHVLTRTGRAPLPALLVAVGVLVVAALVLDLTAPAVAPAAPSGSTEPPSPVNTEIAGLTTFRGNWSRSFIGVGPVPSAPMIRWRVPAGEGERFCSLSAEGLEGSEEKEWCGTGWTGQPNVVEGEEGLEVRIGAFDGRYHFLDAGSGRSVRPDLVTEDLAKGSATTDPDGYPLYYAGSRDGRFRVVALDRPEPTVLWEIDALTTVDRPMWNDDWDGAALLVGDYLLEGGENGWLYVVRLRRAYDAGGLVSVDPEIVATIPGFDDELLTAVEQAGEILPNGLDTRYDVSIESSVAFRDGIVYTANSGGLIQGIDISDLLTGGTSWERVFRFWTGDDTDASIVIDDEGSLYVATEYQRFGERSRELGQLLKLDPSRPDDPVVWSLPAFEIGFEGAGGSWSTPAFVGEHVYFSTAAGRVLAVARATGDLVWELQIGAPAIGSPVVIDGTLLQGDCTGHLYAWDVSDPTVPPPLRWSLDLEDCIESTPAVWDGWIFVGTREGYVYGVADEDAVPPAA
ncbi:MAG TPA: PQQ-binding-like beta-propeller repeat protein [Actinomycetota bacterium]